ncbi:MAG TPA: ubiquinol-cytochrome c reductase iron-sulfur subunit [Ktedonobacteraceae bacterium]|nr:ubiquinol-cytochrome c reductase iron-sulfur subunit [Ktedonobacteraceae bacterium]
MPGEDQERFEDYLELEQFISELQAGHVAHPPQELTPTQACVYRMATLFHAATPGVSEPDASFAEQLQARLEAALQSHQEKASRHQTPTSLLPKALSERKKRVSRRFILTGGAVAAASMVVGAGVDHVADQTMEGNPNEVQLSASPMDWFPVMNFSELGSQAVKFVSESVIGYIVRCNGETSDPSEQGKILALSATCTHKGCIVQWSGSDRKFHCPCHAGVFSEDGGIDPTSSSLYLEALPRLDVKIENDKIYVRVPPK